MNKKCKIDNCNNNVFTHGYCKYHSGLYYSSFKRTSKVKTIKHTKQVSSKRKKALNNIKSIMNDLLESGHGCIFCGTDKQLTPMHVIRRSDSIELQDDPRNIFVACMTHHNIFDDGTGSDIMMLSNIQLVLDRMKELDELYYNRFINSRNIKL